MDNERSGSETAFQPDREVADRFLAQLRTSPNVSAACRAAALPRTTAYSWRKQSAAFAEEWQSALMESIEELEGEVYRRAFHGVAKPVFYQGEECGSVQEYSDTLAIFLLKAHKPEKYRERFEHSGDINFQPVLEVPMTAASIAEWQAAYPGKKDG